MDGMACERPVIQVRAFLSEAAADLGLRVCTCFETPDRDGQAVARAGLEENARFAQAVRAEPRLRDGDPRGRARHYRSRRTPPCRALVAPRGTLR